MFLVLFGAALHAGWTPLSRRARTNSSTRCWSSAGGRSSQPSLSPLSPFRIEQAGLTSGLGGHSFLLFHPGCAGVPDRGPELRLSDHARVRPAADLGRGGGDGAGTAAAGRLAGDRADLRRNLCPGGGFMALGSIPLAPTVFALLNAVVITAYTLVDGVGIRGLRPCRELYPLAFSS